MRIINFAWFLSINAAKSIFAVLFALIWVRIIEKFGVSIFHGVFAITVDDFVTIQNMDIFAIFTIGIFALSPWKNFYNLAMNFTFTQIALKTLIHSAILEVFYIIIVAALTNNFSSQNLLSWFNGSVWIALLANLISFGKYRSAAAS